ncbi:hypothetical protein [Streptomyces meridianus]|uniref:Uncharacterized protein n=1 Tax=Streptomyces meridianus TaxID=2938945 RepID=A0ABT0X7S5_9ACTN|nr:hypothetical protein [Streptomyces meridianus]MCM2578573.1 hypothetical protein [Streptomyces meridianus]
MAPHDGGYAPIYERLVGEQGDVPAQARQAAEAVQRSAQALDINGLSHPQPDPYSPYPPPAVAPHQHTHETAAPHPQGPPEQPVDPSPRSRQEDAAQGPGSSWFQ